MLSPDLLAELDQVLALRRDMPRSGVTARATDRLLRRAAMLDRATKTPPYRGRRRTITRVLCDQALTRARA